MLKEYDTTGPSAKVLKKQKQRLLEKLGEIESANRRLRSEVTGAQGPASLTATVEPDANPCPVSCTVVT